MFSFALCLLLLRIQFHYSWLFKIACFFWFYSCSDWLNSANLQLIYVHYNFLCLQFQCALVLLLLLIAQQPAALRGLFACQVQAINVLFKELEETAKEVAINEVSF